MRARATLIVAALLLCGASWIDPHATAREAARLYTAGNFNGASAKYNEALVEDPDSPLLHYNLGASVYREGKYEEAVTAYGQTPTADVGKVAYNVGNSTYRLGVATEASDPQKAMTLYAAALAAYRRAMGADPNDVDAKFNHEFVTRKMAELQKKLDEEKKKQEQKQDEQKDQQKDESQQQDKQDQDKQQQEQKQDQAQDGQQQNDQQQQDQQQAQDQQQPEDQRQQNGEGSGDEQAKDAAEQKQQAGVGEQGEQQAGEPGNEQAGAAVAGDEQGQMSEHEAQALLDAARDQEARPEDLAKRRQRARVLEPAEDW